MKVLVVGATGFVGAALCARLVQGRDEARALVRERTPVEKLESLRALGVLLHKGELGDPESMMRAAQGADAVVCCAGESFASAKALPWVHVAGIENLLAACRRAVVPRLVLVSCADVTLTGHARVHWKEDAVLGGLPLGALARTKLLGEELALQASDASLSVIALRPAWLWGEGERNNLPLACEQGLAGGVRLYGGGSNFFATAHVKNVLEALMCALESDEARGHAIHVADPDTLTASEFFTSLSRALSLPPPRRGIAALSLFLAQARERLGLAGPGVAEVARRNQSSLLDCLRATTLLGARSVITVEQGMAELEAWAARIGGAKTIASLRRPAATDADAARYQKLADELS